ncbi:hypothetical protein PHLCEN_2v7237 [Hermanssonia centrifuga]|uniref:Uncharacterized protein n=1 Tax=Hermanssonia centrifuga TaxID=98765 RepID=A0A2R6NXX1_9APHY|nr:hypothetical protein PHLCEN_2v7237 [Hermanssonia centrifuga]
MDTPATPTSDSPSSISPSSTPTAGHATPPYANHMTTPVPGSLAYYVYSIGGAQSLAQLYLEAGLLYLEGTASSLLSSSYAGLSSLRTPTLSNSLQPHSRSIECSAATGNGSSGSDAWNRDRELARKYFDRARDLQPGLDVPLLPPQSDSTTSNSNELSPVLDEQEQQLKIPTIELPNMEELAEKQVRKRRKRGEDSLRGDTSASSAVEEKLDADGEDHTWYLYLPGLVGAGTALLVVGFLSFSSWRKGQNS